MMMQRQLIKTAALLYPKNNRVTTFCKDELPVISKRQIKPVSLVFRLDKNNLNIVKKIQPLSINITYQKNQTLIRDNDEIVNRQDSSFISQKNKKSLNYVTSHYSNLPSFEYHNSKQVYNVSNNAQKSHNVFKNNKQPELNTVVSKRRTIDKKWLQDIIVNKNTVVFNRLEQQLNQLEHKQILVSSIYPTYTDVTSLLKSSTHIDSSNKQKYSISNGSKASGHGMRTKTLQTAFFNATRLSETNTYHIQMQHNNAAQTTLAITKHHHISKKSVRGVKRANAELNRSNTIKNPLSYTNSAIPVTTLYYLKRKLYADLDSPALRSKQQQQRIDWDAPQMVLKKTPPQTLTEHDDDSTKVAEKPEIKQTIDIKKISRDVIKELNKIKRVELERRGML